MYTSYLVETGGSCEVILYKSRICSLSYVLAQAEPMLESTAFVCNKANNGLSMEQISRYTPSAVIFDRKFKFCIQFAVAIDSSGYDYVTEVYPNNRIQKFSKDRPIRPGSAKG